MGKLFLHTICSPDNLAEINRMTKDVWLLLDGIIAACHGGKNSETFELLKNRARNGDIYHHDFLDDFSLKIGRAHV